MRDKHKVRIRNSKDGYTNYQAWLERQGTSIEDSSNDILNGDTHWEGHSPWTQIPVSDIQDDQLQALKKLRRVLKGRQKQIVDLLFEGLTSQTEIAKRLNMKQSSVARGLKKISEKILKNTL